MIMIIHTLRHFAIGKLWYRISCNESYIVNFRSGQSPD